MERLSTTDGLETSRAEADGGNSGRGRRWRAVAVALAGGQSLQLGSVHSPALLSRRSRWLMVGRREGFEVCEAVRDREGFEGRGLLLSLRCSCVTVGRRGLGAGLWDAAGAATAGATGGLGCVVALGPESALLTVVVV